MLYSVSLSRGRVTAIEIRGSGATARKRRTRSSGRESGRGFPSGGWGFGGRRRRTLGGAEDQRSYS